MAMNTIGWDLYRSFLGVLNEGSLSGAARSLGITQPTVGRHIATLEKELGLVLFTRTQTGLLPTEAAASLGAYAKIMENTVAALERTAASQGGAADIRGVVRVSCSDVIGVEVLPPIITRLSQTHPGLKIELVLTDRVQDLLQREADIAVRMTKPKQDQLVARRIGLIEVGLHARFDYLEQHGIPRTIADLTAHTTIGYDHLSNYMRQYEKSMQGLQRDLFSLRTDSNLAQLALIRAGAGIGMCQVPLAQRDRNLVRILPKTISLAFETWITMHEDLRRSRACRVTFDALVGGVLSYATS